MIYRQKNKSKYFNAINISIAVIIFVFVLSSMAPNIFSKIANSMEYPLWNGTNFLSNLTRSMLSGIFENLDKDLRIKELESRILENESSELVIKALRQENIELYRLIGDDKTLDYKYKVAKVISTPPTQPYDVIVVNSGSKDEIMVGDKAYFVDNIIIGEVVEVNKNFSKIKLYSSPGKELTLRVGSSTTSVKASGQGSGFFKATTPHGLDIKIGETAFLIGDNLGLAGSVSAIEDANSEGAKNIYIKFPFNINNLNNILIRTERGIILQNE